MVLFSETGLLCGFERCPETGSIVQAGLELTDIFLVLNEELYLILDSSRPGGKLLGLGPWLYQSNHIPGFEKELYSFIMREDQNRKTCLVQLSTHH